MQATERAVDETDFHRECAACVAGDPCTQPYISLDGTVYECRRIIPAAGE